MHFAFDTMRGGAIYALMTQTIVPRPIAWVLSADVAGRTNLAPFSYFAPISSRPPLVSISVGRRPDGRPKDTRANAEATGFFVVHIASRAHLEPLNDSATPLEPGESEVDALGLETTPLGTFPLPRLTLAPVALGCRLYRTVDLAEGGVGLLIGQIEQAWVDDALLEPDARGRLAVDPERLDPIARLGGSLYSTLGDVLSLARKQSL